MDRWWVWIGFVAFCAAGSIIPPAAAQVRIASSDGAIILTLSRDDNGPPRYDVTRRDERMLAPSPLGLRFSDQSSTDRLDGREDSGLSIDRTVPVIAGQPECAFIRDVPTTWDETRFLDGDIGSHIVVARRKDDRGYVGAMTTEQAHPVTLDLGFLGRGRYAATMWQDGARADQVVRSTRVVTAADAVTLSLAGSGGAETMLEPLR